MLRSCLFVCGAAALLYSHSEAPLMQAVAEPSADMFNLDNVDPARFEKQCEAFLRDEGKEISGVDCATVLDQARALEPLTAAQKARVLAIVSEQAFADEVDYKALAYKLDKVVPGLLDSLTENGISFSDAGGARRVTIGARTAGGARFVRPGS